MRIRWQFYFEYEDLKFDKIYKYDATVSKERAEAFGLPALEFEARITIEAEEENHGSIKQRGKMNIFLPGNNEQTENLAYSLALSIADHITFSQARIQIIGSFVSSELLPETPEEEAEVGENRFSWSMRIKEVPDKAPFDSGSLQKVTNSPLIKQFNEANDAKSPIDRFIGLFKILEDLYGGQPVKASFKNSMELRLIALRHLRFEESGTGTIRQISEAEFEKLVDDLVNTRHECAHLRSSTGFGITYGDSRVQSDVEPLLGPLQTLAYEAIRIKIF
jgi:hypothetical protein